MFVVVVCCELFADSCLLLVASHCFVCVCAFFFCWLLGGTDDLSLFTYLFYLFVILFVYLLIYLFVLFVRFCSMQAHAGSSDVAH